MPDMDRTAFQLLFWDALHRQLIAGLGDVLGEEQQDLLKRVFVRLAREAGPVRADSFPLWDLRPHLSLVDDSISNENHLAAERAEEIALANAEAFLEHVGTALLDESGVGELQAYAASISEDDVTQFDVEVGLASSGEEDFSDSDALELERELEALREEEEVAVATLPHATPFDAALDELEAELSAGNEPQADAPPMAAAEPEPMSAAPASSGFDDLLGSEPMPDLLGAGSDDLSLPGLDEPMMEMPGMPMPGMDEPAAASATEAAAEAEQAVLAQLENMDFSQMSEADMARLLGAEGELEPDVAPMEPAFAAAEGLGEMSFPEGDEFSGDLNAEMLASLEQELEGAEAAAEAVGVAEEADGGRPGRQMLSAIQLAERGLTAAEAQMTPQDLVRSRMIRISEAVEELSDNPDDRLLIQQLIEHFAVITRPITRMGFRTFASLSDALVSALEYCRDSDLEAPPMLCNNLRELVTTLAEVVEGRWSKYKTFYWLINKLNSTIRHMEELVQERDEQRFMGSFGSFQETEEVEDQIARKKEEAEGRQRAQLTDLQEIFVQEANEHIDMLNRNLLLAERNPSDQETIYALMRSAHSIKGSANISKFPKIAELGHVMEDVMVAIRDNGLMMTPAIIDVMLHSVDRLQAMIANVEYEVAYDEAPIEELKAKLNALGHELQTNPDKYKAAADAIDAELQKKVGLKVERKTAEAAPDPRAEEKKAANTVRVDYENLNSLLNQAAELVINRTRLSGQIETLRQFTDNLTHEKKRLRATEQRLDRAIEEVSVEMTSFLNTGRALSSAASMGNGQAMAAESSAILSRLSQARATLGRLLRIHESGMLSDFADSEFDRFSEFDVIWRDLRESVTHVDDLIDHFEAISSNLDQNISRISLIANDLHEQIMRIRMIPVSQIFNRFPRTVRDISRQLEKKIALRMVGEETPLDKTIIEDLTDPMIHLVRNACDHGIETPGDREDMGKPAEGTISLAARQEGNQVVIEIKDDGKGIDIEAVKRKAVERRIMTEEQANRASESELINLIFAPGFSTAAKTTDISGRGVGMDVVKTAIAKLKGNIQVQSELGEGTTFTIRLPLTLAISQALLFTASGSRFAIQLSAVDETMMVREDAIMRTMGSEIIKLRDEVLPLVRLNQVLALGAPEESSGERPVVIINSGGSRRVGVIVDRLVGREEVVVKNLGTHLKNVRYISGGTILGDGAVTLILDIVALVEQVKPMQGSDIGGSLDDGHGIGVDMESYRQAVAGAREKIVVTGGSSTTLEDSGLSDSSHDMPAMSAPPVPMESGQPHILVTDDSISIRRFVGSILEAAGYRITLANDGVDAMEKLKNARFDLILTDLEMPRMHGYELIAEVKQNIAYKNIPIIILTGRAGEKHSRKGMELGASAFLVKPFNEQELLSEISRNLQRSHA